MDGRDLVKSRQGGKLHWEHGVQSPANCNYGILLEKRINVKPFAKNEILELCDT